MGIQSNRNRAYSNDEITVFWRASECTHATICYSLLRSVFDPLKRPWVNMDGASTNKILEIVEKCPSPALTFRWHDEQKNSVETSKKLFTGSINDFQNKSPQIGTDQAPGQATITIRPDGPIIVNGNFELTDQNNEKLGSWKMISICRCGQSSNMPYCDGAHFKSGFKAK